MQRHSARSGMRTPACCTGSPACVRPTGAILAGVAVAAENASVSIAIIVIIGVVRAHISRLKHCLQLALVELSFHARRGIASRRIGHGSSCWGASARTRTKPCSSGGQNADWSTWDGCGWQRRRWRPKQPLQLRGVVRTWHPRLKARLEQLEDKRGVTGGLSGALELPLQQASPLWGRVLRLRRQRIKAFNMLVLVIAAPVRFQLGCVVVGPCAAHVARA